MSKVLLFGEALIRISPSASQTFTNQVQTNLYYGGSEVNIARALQGFKQDTRLLTALPNNQIGNTFMTFLSSNHIDVSAIQQLDHRLGIYFVQPPYGCRQGDITYDRDLSCLHYLRTNNIDFDALFDNVSIFHFSGITLALSNELRNMTKLLIKEAKKREVLLSLDLNFRSHLIDPLEAKRVFSEFAKDIDICFGIEPLMLSESDTSFFDRSMASLDDIKTRMVDLTKAFDLQTIFHTSRLQDEWGRNCYQAYLYNKSTEFAVSKKITTPILERIGSGDAFVAGALYQLLQNNHSQDVVDFAVAAASLKCTISGDNMFESPENVKKVLNQTNDIVR
ncbi:sugar kinase [Streptococcus jiangjianxini]|uniref:sugar kinase n=1 Tax=Streptococcus jiangjianxini TaxID=3161189 RepID=UPI0032ED613E